MEPSIADSLIYSPACSWVARGPQVFFTSGLLCRGELFKAAVQSEIRPMPVLRLQIIGAGGEVIQTIEESPDDPFPPRPLFRGFRLDTSELPRAGSYVARVSTVPHDGEDAERAESERDGWSTLGEYEFHVLDRDDYLAHWLELFGETWGEPVYWDRLEGDRPEALEELLIGLPVGGLFEALPEDFELNARNLGGLVGPLAFALAGDEGVGLPCYAEFLSTWETGRPPHIDLTKLFWLLNALAPALLNASLFSYRLRPRTRVYEWGLMFDVDFYSYIYEERPDDADEVDRLAPLVALVGRVSDFAEIEFRPGEGFRLTVKEERDETRDEPAAFGMRRA
jgi:hypothetical protein